VLRLIWILITLPFRILGWILGIKRPAPPPKEEDPEDDLEDFLDFMEEYEYFEGEE
jgi:hypothetical protein